MRAALYLASAILVSYPAAAASQRPLIVTTQDHSLVEVDDCANFHTRNTTSLPAQAHAEEQQRVRITGTDVLKVRASNEGGVTVRGWDRPFARLTVCKSAVALSDVQAKNALDKISVVVKNGEIAALGPEMSGTQTWWVHMILHVPRSANLDVAAANGGIAIRNMNGRVTARATNGGISLASVTGDSNVSTENGGISLDKIGGKINATSQNGPISLKVRDTNAPSIEAQTDDTGEILCHLKNCSEASAKWAADRKHVRIGGSGPSIRLTSYTADIMIEQVR